MSQLSNQRSQHLFDLNDQILDYQQNVKVMSREELEKQVLKLRQSQENHKSDQKKAQQSSKWYHKFEKSILQGAFQTARKILKDQKIKTIIGQKRHQQMQKLYDDFYKKYCQKGEEKWKFWLLVAVIGILSLAALYWTGAATFLWCQLRNQAYHISLRIIGGIGAVIGWVAGICRGLAAIVYKGWNYLMK